MKTKELIKKANELRLIGASIQDGYISFCETTLGIEFYRYPVWGIGRGDGYAAFKNAGDIYMVDLFKIMDLLDEYMKTPDLEREDEKRYRLKKIPITLLGEGDEDLFLMIDLSGGSNGISYTDAGNTQYFQTIFTESEIAEMNIAGFDPIEVME